MSKAAALVCLILIACSKDAVTTPTSSPSSSSSSTTPPPPSASIAAAPKTPTSLADFLPPTLDGTKLETLADIPGMPLPKGAAVGSYLNAAARKSININLMPVLDLATSRAQFHKLKPGQTKDAPAARLAFKAFDVNGYTVERVQYIGGTKKSEARILLADKVDVNLSVEPTDDPDESIALIKQLDLAGIDAFAKKM